MSVPNAQPTDRDVSHGLLLGLLRSLGGSAELTRADYNEGCTNAAGEWHSVALEPLDEHGRVRLVIVERAADGGQA